MSKVIYNEGRVVGLSAYEIYIRQFLQTNPNGQPASEREWLASSLAMGSSLLLKFPSVADDGDSIVDIPLPENSKLCGASTLIASFFNGEGAVDAGKFFATRVTDYGELISNQSHLGSVASVPHDCPTTEDITLTTIPPKSNLAWSEATTSKLKSYTYIIDGIVVQPGNWSESPLSPPVKVLEPDMTQRPVLRFHVTHSIAEETRPFILITGLSMRTVVQGETGVEISIPSPSPEDGDFLGPEAFPWAAKIIFTIPPGAIYYLDNYILPTATHTVLGGVRAGADACPLPASREGVCVDSDGKMYVSKLLPASDHRLGGIKAEEDGREFPNANIYIDPTAHTLKAELLSANEEYFGGIRAKSATSAYTQDVKINESGFLKLPLADGTLAGLVRAESLPSGLETQPVYINTYGKLVTEYSSGNFPNFFLYVLHCTPKSRTNTEGLTTVKVWDKIIFNVFGFSKDLNDKVVNTFGTLAALRDPEEHPYYSIDNSHWFQTFTVDGRRADNTYSPNSDFQKFIDDLSRYCDPDHCSIAHMPMLKITCMSTVNYVANFTNNVPNINCGAPHPSGETTNIWTAYINIDDTPYHGKSVSDNPNYEQLGKKGDGIIYVRNSGHTSQISQSIVQCSFIPYDPNGTYPYCARFQTNIAKPPSWL